MVGAYQLQYDAENRQKRAQDTSTIANGAAIYQYDGDGHRVQKLMDSGSTVYVHDAFGKLTGEYTNFAGAAPLCGTCYLSKDHLGNTRLVTDASMNVVARHDYLPFGSEIPAGYAGRDSRWGVSDAVSRKFTGQERDAETGMDYFQARYFSAAQGRFNSVDPANAGADLLNPQSWNGYAYVNNNPMNAVGPSGLSCIDLGGGSQADDGDGQGCPGAGVAPGDPNDPSTLNQGQTNAQSNGSWEGIPYNSTSPWDLGWQWATGTGPRSQQFGPDSPMTLLLQQHSHIQNVKQSICGQMRNGQTPLAGDQSNNYKLGGLQGVPKYFRDYSTLLSGGATGNLAVTYLGSYALTYNVTSFDIGSGTASVQFHVSNTSTIASATHPPVLGYTNWWDKNVGQPLNDLFKTGPFSQTTQDFYWTENLNGCQVQ